MARNRYQNMSKEETDEEKKRRAAAAAKVTVQKPTFRAQDIAPKVVLSKTPVSQNKITTEKPIVLSKTTVKSTPVVKTPASSYLTGGAPTKAGTPYAARLQGNSQITPKTNGRTAGGFSSGRSKTGKSVRGQDSQISSIGDLRRSEYAPTAAEQARARARDIDRITQNSIAWHKADDTGKQALFAKNEAIRKKYGMTYNDYTGESFQRNQVGLVENLSKPVNAYVKTQENYDKQNPLTVAGHNTMAGLAGASGGLYKTLDFILPDVVTPKPVQNLIDSAAENADSIKEKVRTYNYDRGGKVGGVVGDLYQGGIEMVPAAVLSLLTAGQSATAQAVSAMANVNKGLVAKVIEGIAKSPAAWTSFARTVGSDYEQARQNGASDAQAAVSAIISSGINAGIEIGGGVEALAGREASLKNLLRSAGEEGMEEVKQGVISALTQKGVYDKDAPYYSTTDDSAVINPVRMLQEYGSGALLGGVIGAGKAIGNKGFGGNLQEVQQQNAVQTDLTQNQVTPAEVVASQAARTINTEAQNPIMQDVVRKNTESQALGQNTEANKVALAQRFAQLENDLRDAKMLLPGTLRDNRVAHITNQLDAVWQEMTGKTVQASQGVAENVAESEDNIAELRAAWENKRIAKQQAEKTKQELTLTVRDMQMAENAARSGMDSVQWDKADNPEQAYIYGSALRAERDADFPIREYFARRTGEMQSTAQEAANAIASYAKDKKLGLQYERETMERNIRDIFGKDHQDAAEEIIREYITPIHAAVADGTRIKNAYRSRVKELNLTKQESALVQLRMEGETGGEAEYIKNNDINVTSEMNAKINHAAQVMREIYNELFDKINEVQIRNGQEPTMFRKNYAPHFTLDKPDTMIGKVRFALGLGKDSSLSLPTDIAGITEEFRPGKKWFGNLLQRKGEITDYDAVYGFDHYIETAADVITLTDSIQKLRVLEDEVRYTLSDEGVRDKIDEIRANAEYDALQKRQAMEDVWEDNQTNAQQLINDLKNQKQMGMGGFVTELRRYTDNLAGKKSKEDRGWETKLNRQVYQVTKNLEGRVAANMIALNPGSWLTNFIPLTQASGEVSTGNLLRGMKETVRSFVKDDGFKDASDFLTNRYGSERIDQTLTQKASAAAVAPMEWIDHITSQAIVRARTNQNIQNGMSFADAVANADEFTASLMADRSKGSMPTIFNATNPVTKVFTMFQLEVNNQLSYLFKDMPKAQAEKGIAAVAAAYTKVFVGAYLYNIAYKSAFGRDSALDPIGMIMDALGIGDDEDDKKKTGWDVAESLMASTAENLPFVGGVIGGGRVPISSALPDVGNLWNSLSGDAASEKKQDALRKEVTKPLVYLLPPFGGGAIKKAAEGFATVRAGGSYVHDTNGNDILQFPVYNQKPTDYAKAMIAGKWSSEEAQDYVDSGFKGLSAAQTEVYNTLRDRYNADSKTVMDTIKALSGVESEKDADGNELKSAKTIKQEMLFDMDGLTISQKREIDRKLISGGDTPKPASYNDRDSFMISVYVPESRKDAARETIKAGFTIDQFIEYNDMLRDAKNQDHVSSSAARQQVLQNIRNNTQLTGEKMSELVEHVLISDLGETRRDDWEDVYKGKISAGQYLEIAGKYSEIKEKYDDIDGIKSKAQRESTEFGKWVDSLPLDRDIKASIIDDFDYSNFVPATATPYRWDMLTSEDAKAVAPKLEASGMKIDTYNDIRDACSEFKADKDANGKTISGSKKTKVVNYIRGRDDLTPEQQNLMIQSYGYKVSSGSGSSKKTSSGSSSFKSLPTFKKLKGF